MCREQLTSIVGLDKFTNRNLLCILKTLNSKNRMCSTRTFVMKSRKSDPAAKALFASKKFQQNMKFDTLKLLKLWRKTAEVTIVVAQRQKFFFTYRFKCPQVLSKYPEVETPTKHTQLRKSTKSLCEFFPTTNCQRNHDQNQPIRLPLRKY